MNKINEYGNLGIAIAKLYEAINYMDKVVEDDKVGQITNSVKTDIVYSITHLRALQDRLKDIKEVSVWKT